MKGRIKIADLINLLGYFHKVSKQSIKTTNRNILKIWKESQTRHSNKWIQGKPSNRKSNHVQSNPQKFFKRGGEMFPSPLATKSITAWESFSHRSSYCYPQERSAALLVDQPARNEIKLQWLRKQHSFRNRVQREDSFPAFRNSHLEAR